MVTNRKRAKNTVTNRERKEENKGKKEREKREEEGRTNQVRAFNSYGYFPPAGFPV